MSMETLQSVFWYVMGALLLCVLFIPTIAEQLGRLLIAHAQAFRAARAEYWKTYSHSQGVLRGQE